MANKIDLIPCTGISCKRKYRCQRFSNAHGFKQLYDVDEYMPLIEAPINTDECQWFFPVNEGNTEKSRYCGSTNPELNG